MKTVKTKREEEVRCVCRIEYERGSAGSFSILCSWRFNASKRFGGDDGNREKYTEQIPFIRPQVSVIAVKNPSVLLTGFLESFSSS